MEAAKAEGMEVAESSVLQSRMTHSEDDAHFATSCCRRESSNGTFHWIESVESVETREGSSQCSTRRRKKASFSSAKKEAWRSERDTSELSALDSRRVVS